MASVRPANAYAARYRLPGARRHSPVDAFEQHGQLRRGQQDAAAVGLRPDEAALLQALGEEAKALAIPPQQLDNVAAPTTKDEHVPRERILKQRQLGNACQAVEAFAHVGHARCQPHPGARRQADHRGSARICRTVRSPAASKPGGSRTVPAPVTISMQDATAELAQGRPDDGSCTGVSMTFTASMVAVDKAVGAPVACRARRTHLRMTLALMLWLNATADKEAPGSRHCAATWRCDLALELRRELTPRSSGEECRSWHSSFGVRYIHDGRHLCRCRAPSQGR